MAKTKNTNKLEKSFHLSFARCGWTRSRKRGSGRRKRNRIGHDRGSDPSRATRGCCRASSATMRMPPTRGSPCWRSSSWTPLPPSIGPRTASPHPNPNPNGPPGTCESYARCCCSASNAASSRRRRERRARRTSPTMTRQLHVGGPCCFSFALPARASAFSFINVEREESKACS